MNKAERRAFWSQTQLGQVQPLPALGGA